jgi:TonB family protein
MESSLNISVSRFTIALLLALVLLATAANANAQQPAGSPSEDRDRGIQLFREGNIAQAIKIFEKVIKKHSDDADAWYYLGLAYWSEGAIGAARPAFEHVIQLRPELPNAHAKLAYSLILANEPQTAVMEANRAIALGDPSAEPHYAIAEASFRGGDNVKAIEEANLALKIRPEFGEALITKSLAHRALKQYDDAAKSLEIFLVANPEDWDKDLWREQLVSLRGFFKEPAASTAPSSGVKPALDLPLSGKEMTVKARILSKPEPSYTEAARIAGVTGTVVIKCVFASDGEIRYLVITRALPYGLTSRAVQAARRIKFVPAMKDGRPASMFMQLEYNFNLY